MADKIPGISTLGTKLYYAVESTAGTAPAGTAYKQLTRINAIGGIANDVETIDASALEDEVEKSVAGRGSNGGNFTITVNITADTIAEWTTVISEYRTAKEAGKQMYFQIAFAGLAGKSFFVIAEPPLQIPMPSIDQNGLLTVEMSMTINNYVGIETSKLPAAA